MFRSTQLAAVAIAMTALAAAYAVPASAVQLGAGRTAQAPYSSAPTNGHTVGFPLMDDNSEPILPRAYRSKCDDLTDTMQRDHCFRTEQDDSFKDTDGMSTM